MKDIIKDQLIITKEMLEKYDIEHCIFFNRDYYMIKLSWYGNDRCLYFKIIQAKSLKQLQDKLNKLIC